VAALDVFRAGRDVPAKCARGYRRERVIMPFARPLVPSQMRKN
jgi:hypothetical protein